MTLQRLSALVLAVVLGTAATVNWYLDAEEAAQDARQDGSRAVVHQHLPLPMRAEPARFRWVRAGAWRPQEGPSADPAPVSVPALAPLVRRPAAGGEAPTLVHPSSFGLESGTF